MMTPAQLSRIADNEFRNKGLLYAQFTLGMARSSFSHNIISPILPLNLDIKGRRLARTEASFAILHPREYPRNEQSANRKLFDPTVTVFRTEQRYSI